MLTRRGSPAVLHPVRISGTCAGGDRPLAPAPLFSLRVSLCGTAEDSHASHGDCENSPMPRSPLHPVRLLDHPSWCSSSCARKPCRQTTVAPLVPSCVCPPCDLHRNATDLAGEQVIGSVCSDHRRHRAPVHRTEPSFCSSWDAFFAASPVR